MRNAWKCSPITPRCCGSPRRSRTTRIAPANWRAACAVRGPAPRLAGTKRRAVSRRRLRPADTAARLDIPALVSVLRPHLEHDQEKWIPVFRQDHAQIKYIERDDVSKKG